MYVELMDNLVEVADKYKARRREALQHLISQGLVVGAELELRLYSDIERSNFENFLLVKRKNLETERADVEETGDLVGSGHCADYDEDNGWIKISHLWDNKNNCSSPLFPTYSLCADAIYEMRISRKAVPPISD